MIYRPYKGNELIPRLFLHPRIIFIIWAFILVMVINFSIVLNVSFIISVETMVRLFLLMKKSITNVAFSRFLGGTLRSYVC